MEAFAQLDSPDDGETFQEVANVLFQSSADHKVTLTNTAPFQNAYSYWFKFALYYWGGPYGLTPRLLDEAAFGSSSSPVMWSAPPGGTVTNTSSLSKSRNFSAGEYFAEAWTELYANVGIVAAHEHEYEVVQ